MAARYVASVIKARVRQAASESVERRWPFPSELDAVVMVCR
ncbi:hypothetical protein [Natrarchaeobaculum sulfurireducens]|nr:hypothetical protein [Natrarchaeobaculum sulfurireducens]